MTARRYLGVAVAAAVTLVAGSGARGQVARAASPLVATATTRDLTAGDFYGYHNSASFVSGAAANAYAVAHDHYRRAIILKSCGSADPQLRTNVSLNASQFHGFHYVTFTLGVNDTDNPNTQARFTATADGRPVFEAILGQGRVAQRVTLALGHTGVFNFIAVETQGVCADVVMGEPTLTTTRPSAPLPGPARQPRALTRADFYDYRNGASFLVRDSTAAVAGERYAWAVSLKSCGSADPQLRTNVSLHSARVRSYRALSFAVGISDADNPGTQATFSVTADGRTVYTTMLTQNRISKHVRLTIGRIGVFNFYAVETSGVCARVLMGNPTAQP